MVSRALPLLLLLVAAPSFAQHEGHQMPAAPPTTAWRWTWDANVFLTLNLQQRKFRDFHQVESQNWFMGMGRRTVGRGALQVDGMISLEPFTLRGIGSAQVFQTGETYQGASLVDYQHPHDLLMHLGARYDVPLGDGRVFVAGALAGDPALGPTAFMHRATGVMNPQAPLSHHTLDATHISNGVLTAGAARSGVGLAASWFRGREPDETRTDIDVGRLDSWSVQGSWRASGWDVQASGGHLTRPELLEPGNQVRLTASVGRTDVAGDTRFSWFGAWGENRDFDGRHEALVAEAALAPGARDTWFGRVEHVDKNILTSPDYDPPGTRPHRYSRVGALTVGYVRHVARWRALAASIGASVTGYRVPAELKAASGRPWSAEVMLRVCAVR